MRQTVETDAGADEFVVLHRKVISADSHTKTPALKFIPDHMDIVSLRIFHIDMIAGHKRIAATLFKSGQIVFFIRCDPVIIEVVARDIHIVHANGHAATVVVMDIIIPERDVFSVFAFLQHHLPTVTVLLFLLHHKAHKCSIRTAGKVPERKHKSAISDELFFTIVEIDMIPPFDQSGHPLGITVSLHIKTGIGIDFEKITAEKAAAGDLLTFSGEIPFLPPHLITHTDRFAGVAAGTGQSVTHEKSNIDFFHHNIGAVAAGCDSVSAFHGFFRLDLEGTVDLVPDQFCVPDRGIVAIHHSDRFPVECINGVGGGKIFLFLFVVSQMEG